MLRKSKVRIDSAGLLLACVLLAAAFFKSDSYPVFVRAAQGLAPALAVVFLRLMLEVLFGLRRSKWVVANTTVAACAACAAFWQWPPMGMWAILISLGLFLASLIGLFRFRFTSFFMLLCCGKAGALLL